MKKFIIFISATLILFLTTQNSVFTNNNNQPDKQSLLEQLNKQSFIENQGQIKDTDGKIRHDILFITKMNNQEVFFQKDRISIVLMKQENYQVSKYRLDMRFLNSNNNTIVSGIDELDSYYNYFKDDSKTGITHVSMYNRIRYSNVYDNIDLVFYFNNGGLKYDWVINPDANPHDIELAFDGSNGIDLIDNTLNIKTPYGSLTENIPLTYQYASNEQDKINIGCSYKLENSTIKYVIDKYDKSKEIIIDPSLEWTNHIGGTNNEYVGQLVGEPFQSNNSALDFMGGGVAIDSSGYYLITGTTISSNFPATIGAYSGSYDIFVAKYNSSSVRQWCTIAGGDYLDTSTDIAIAENDSIVVVGSTRNSAWFNSAGRHQSTCASCIMSFSDAFVLKLTPSGAISYGTYLGGEAFDGAHCVAIDENYNIAIIGDTRSMTNIAIGGSIGQSTCNSCAMDIDAFVSKFDPSLTTCSWSTYYGGNREDNGMGIAFDSADSVVVTGGTRSDTLFPAPLDTIPSNTLNTNGTYFYRDAFLGVLNGSSGAFIKSAYFGGEGEDYANGLYSPWYHAPLAYFTGYTEGGIPTTGDRCELQQDYSGNGDAFIANYILSNNTTPPYTYSFSPFYVSYIGGDGFDCGHDVDSDTLNGLCLVYVVGTTKSDNLPLLHPLYSQINGDGTPDHYDAFIRCSRHDGWPYWLTYFGSEDDDYGLGIAYDGGDLNEILFGGITYDELPMHPDNGNQADFTGSNGYSDAFFSLLSPHSNFPTYFGGDYITVANGICTDAQSYIYITGYMEEEADNDPTFPTSVGVVKEELNYDDYKDVFIAKFTVYGNLVWATLFGGDETNDVGMDIDVSVSGDDDQAGVCIGVEPDIFVCGYTETEGLGTSGVHKRYKGADEDGFLMKLSGSGDEVLWFTYIGDVVGVKVGGDDRVLACDYNDGEIGITGFTNGDLDDVNTNEDYGDLKDAIVGIYFESDGDAFACGYYGFGTYDDEGRDVYYWGDSSIVITGYTESSDLIPMDGEDDELSGNSDAFYAVFECDGSGDLASVDDSYLGGNDDDCANAIYSTNTSTIYIGGWTESDSDLADSGYDNSYSAGKDGFLAKFIESGGSFTKSWATYLGGASDDIVNDIVVSDYILVCGETESTSDIAEGTVYDNSHNGNKDAFVMKISINGQAKSFGTYYGGSANDMANAMTIFMNDPIGENNIVFTGETSSSNLPVSDYAFQETLNGATSRAYITMLEPDGSAFLKPIVIEEKAEQKYIQQNGLLLYPNPVEDALNLRYYSRVNAEVEFTILDLLGTVIYEDRGISKIGYNHHAFSVNNLTSGVYLLKLRHDNGIIKTIKFIKE